MGVLKRHMSLPRLFFLVSVLLFFGIGVLTMIKRHGASLSIPEMQKQKTENVQPSVVEEKVDLSLLHREQKKRDEPNIRSLGTRELIAQESECEERSLSNAPSVIIEHDDEPEAIQQLFVKGSSCPIVETVRYSSRVAWRPKKQAWLVDYASYYKTPLDFIVRSLTGAQGKEFPTVQEGQQFTVLRRDVPFYFHMVISFASMKMRLYYVLPKENRAVFLRGYPVCLGRKDSNKTSGSLTPLGVYQLGSRVAIFHPKMMGQHKGARVELVQVFGTRWIPFESEMANCTEPAKGFGIHGAPLVYNATSGQLEENLSSIGTYASDGCIRLKRQDVEELFSVISTRTSYVEIVHEFCQSQLMQGKLFTN